MPFLPLLGAYLRMFITIAFYHAYIGYLCLRCWVPIFDVFNPSILPSLYRIFLYIVVLGRGAKFIKDMVLDNK